MKEKIYRIYVNNGDGDLVHGYYDSHAKALTELWKYCQDSRFGFKWEHENNLLEVIEIE